MSALFRDVHPAMLPHLLLPQFTAFTLAKLPALQEHPLRLILHPTTITRLRSYPPTELSQKPSENP